MRSGGDGKDVSKVQSLGCNGGLGLYSGYIGVI